MGLRILSGGGFHDWIDDDFRKRRQKILDAGWDPTLIHHQYNPMVCLNCGTASWRERGSGRIHLLDETIDNARYSGHYFRRLDESEMTCEYMMVKQLMEA